MKPEEINALAARVESYEFSNVGKGENESPEILQNDRHWTAILLRRHAQGIGERLEAQKTGAQYIRGARIEMPPISSNSRRGCGDGGWRDAVAGMGPIFSNAQEAKDHEVMRAAIGLSENISLMIHRFARERATRGARWPDEKLRCALGVDCLGCPILRRIDAAFMPDEAKDEAKAWTCAAHILLESDHESNPTAQGDLYVTGRVERYHDYF